MRQPGNEAQIFSDGLTYCDGLATCSLGVDICEAAHASLELQVIGSLQWAWQ